MSTKNRVVVPELEPTGRPRYRIQTIARMTGFGTPLLRAWERRHGLIHPARGPSGYREYSEDDLAVLQRAKILLDQGFSIGEIAAVGRVALLESKAPQALLERSEPDEDSEARSLVEPFCRAVQRGAVAVADEIVARALLRSSLGVALRGFVQPVLVLIGERWEKGEVTVGVERLATHLLRVPLERLLTSANTGLGSVQVLCAPGLGDSHELGALMVALEVARAGIRSVHLGGILDADGIASVATLTRARFIALSYVHSITVDRLRQQVTALRSHLKPRVRIVVGGRGIDAIGDQVHRTGAEAPSSIEELIALTRSVSKS